MGRRRVLLAVPVLAAVLAAMVGGYMLGAQQAKTQNGAGNGNPAAAIGVTLDVKVIRNGTVLAERRVDGDPLLRNFAAFLVKFIGSRNDPEDDDKIILIDGNAVSGSFNDYSSDGNTGSFKAKIRVGTGTTPVSPNDYKLENEVASFDIQNADIIINGTTIVVHVYGSHVFEQAYNITEIGLSIEGVDYSRQPFLIARDVLSQPIQLQPGDALAVSYYITING